MNIIDKYKKFKENRRIVGFSKLGFWFIFFGIIIVIVIMNGGTSKHESPKKEDKPVEQNEPKGESESKEEINSYNFEYIFNDQKYSGTYFKNEIEIIGEKTSFYLKDDEIFTDTPNSIIPNYEYVDIYQLQAKIADLEADSTTKYRDGTTEYTYIINFLTIKYIVNLDKTFKAIISDDNNNIEISYYDINKATLNVDMDKYKYKYKEGNNEH